MIFREYSRKTRFSKGIIITILGVIFISALFLSDIWAQENEQNVAPEAAADAEDMRPEKIPFPKPNSHTGSWLEYHGHSIQKNWNKGGDKSKTCYTCHTQNDCVSCHNSVAPRDHNNIWTTRSHGFQAGGNRDRCLNCHRQDFCVRCHAETAPRNHRGNWKNDHCNWCHFSSASGAMDNCVVCHKLIPEH